MEKAVIEVLGGFLVASAILFPVDGMRKISRRMTNGDLRTEAMSEDVWHNKENLRRLLGSSSPVPRTAYHLVLEGVIDDPARLLFVIDSDFYNLRRRGADPDLSREDSSGHSFTPIEYIDFLLAQDKAYKACMSRAEILAQFGAYHQNFCSGFLIIEATKLRQLKEILMKF